ncbi:MAG: sulfatase [Promethearchaeota archaeon]
MNVILILLDSLNKSYIQPYGNKRVETKNMQKLAEKGVVFENHFICSAACMPARRELFSGRKNEFLWRGWGAVEPFDRLLPIEAKKLGAITALITDHYHYWEGGAGVFGYHESYSYTNLIRGHEFDVSCSEPLENPKEYPLWVKAYLKWRPHQKKIVRYYRNVKHFKSEEDFHGPKVMQAACDWLDKNHSHEKFFLHIESFDPHEPWYIPEPYRSMYGTYKEDFTCWPPYQSFKKFKKFIKQASEDELQFIRNQYSGKVTMVDRWIGKVFEKMDQYNLWKNTMVILTADHGHALAEPWKIIKQYGKSHPIFEDVANIPLIIYHPEIEGNKRIKTTFSTIVDIRATILNALGAKLNGPEMVDGKSLIPILKNEISSIREYILYGAYGFGINLTTWDATYIRGFDSKKPLYWYSSSIPLMMSPSIISGMGETLGIKIPFKIIDFFVKKLAKKIEAGFFIPGVKIPQWRIPLQFFIFSGLIDKKNKKKNYLFDRKNDPNFQKNLAGSFESIDLEQKMIKKLIQIMKEEGAPLEQFSRLMLKKIERGN